MPSNAPPGVPFPLSSASPQIGRPSAAVISAGARAPYPVRTVLPSSQCIRFSFFSATSQRERLKTSNVVLRSASGSQASGNIPETSSSQSISKRATCQRSPGFCFNSRPSCWIMSRVHRRAGALPGRSNSRQTGRGRGVPGHCARVSTSWSGGPSGLA